MLRIEFAGCTSSGKTTLVGEVRRRLESIGLPVVTPFELVLGAGWARSLRTDSRRSLISGVLVAPLAVVFCCRHAALGWLLFSGALRHASSPGRAAARAWSLVGKMGADTYLRLLRGRPGIVLIDEGMLHAAHNALVHAPAGVRDEVVERFARAVPLNDLIVLVKAPAAEIARRTVGRSDPPVRTDPPEELLRFASETLRVFDRLAAHGRIRGSVIEVDLGGGATRLDEAAAEVTRQVKGLAVEARSRRLRGAA